ncbi:hypothetical protein SUNI508_13400 [Seiridium unicorne]|uniref:Uncharacterized protein n=1 Tax=Seiridium unicorne TaxID=138068 RepID=A0ABR2VDA4_9PEZI
MFIHRRHITAQQTLLGPEPFFLDDNGTSRDLADEWRNPKVVIATVLMIVGGNVIRSALSQATGPHCTPICFSFGWVSYAVSALADIFGEGKLLPLPDHAVKVFNLSTGYSRLNRNWVIGRMVRDHPSIISEEEPLGDNGIRIAVYEAQSRDTNPPRNKMLYISCVFTVAVQLVVASVPAILSNGSEWGKLPNKQNSTQTYALTAGNGSRDVMIIKGNGHCYDLEELAAAESPENGRPWVKIPSLSKAREGSRRRVSREVWGKPLGFLITRGASGLKRNPQERGIPLKLTDTISTWKVMDGLMDLESPAATARQLKGAISNQSGQSQIHNLNLGESSGSRGVGSIDAIAKTVSSRSQNEAADAAEERVKLTKHPDWD